MTDMSPVKHEELTDLVRRTQLSFVGTVTRVGGTSLAAVPAEARNDRTAVVRVDQVLHAPEAFRQLAGSEVTVQLSPDAGLMGVGDRAAFFTQGMVYGEGLGVTEVGRLPAGAVQHHVSLAATTADEQPFTSVQREIRHQDLAAHAAEADAVVVGTVVGLERAGGADRADRRSEHSPDWWRASIAVTQVESGRVNDATLAVLYPNSRDAHYYRVPKPRAGQEGLWLLHATQDDQRELAPYELIHPEDYQPVHKLAVLRERR
ncbi:hypothetical protein ACFVVA_09180 [Kitasatospora sp. NPDC058048]|uniref:hypothetical protein n=1 Tax=Kitasatospora sp. NPDC058048 TaxID=3346313 RepID=UPI0036DEB579